MIESAKNILLMLSNTERSIYERASDYAQRKRLALGGPVETGMLVVQKELLLMLIGVVYSSGSCTSPRQPRSSCRPATTSMRAGERAPASVSSEWPRCTHHFEALGMHETKIVTGFRIAAAVGVLVALLLLRV